MQLLSAKFVISMANESLVNGAVLIENGEIFDLGPESELLSRYPHAEHLEFADMAMLPGLINVHTHLDMGGMTKPEKLQSYIEWLLATFDYKRSTNVADQMRFVEQGLEECIQNGTTCIADMGSCEGIFRLLLQKQMRAVVFPEVLSINNAVAKNLFENALSVIDKFQDMDSDLIHVGLAPYSAFTLSRNLLRIISQYARSSRLPVMIHVAESFTEMEFFHDSTGDIATHLFPNIGWDDLPPEHRLTPIQHLSRTGFLEAQPLLVGCTQATPTDLDLIARSGSKVVITPRSHLNLNQGKVSYRDMAKRHILTVLGTDGLSSVSTLSLWDEMRAFYEQHRDVLPLNGREILSMVTSRAAHALGLEDEIGTLEIGKKADLILVDALHIDRFEKDVGLALIQSTKSENVKHVMIGGRWVKHVQ